MKRVKRKALHAFIYVLGCGCSVPSFASAVAQRDVLLLLGRYRRKRQYFTTRPLQINESGWLTEPFVKISGAKRVSRTALCNHLHRCFEFYIKVVRLTPVLACRGQGRGKMSTYSVVHAQIRPPSRNYVESHKEPPILPSDRRCILLSRKPRYCHR